MRDPSSHRFDFISHYTTSHPVLLLRAVDDTHFISVSNGNGPRSASSSLAGVSDTTYKETACRRISAVSP